MLHMAVVLAGHLILLVGSIGIIALLIRRHRNHRRLVRAALDVINDYRERKRIYPGYYNQPNYVRVMNELIDATQEN